MAYEQLKYRIKESPVSLIIGNFIPLKKKGSNLEAICPFHADTKPSLKVNDAKGMYKCFACGAGGDAITFVMEYKKLDFLEAIKEIAQILSLPFEDEESKKRDPKIEMAFRVLNVANKIYRKIASQSPPPYSQFVEQRKLSPESLEKWQIGHAGNNNPIFNYLSSIKESEGERARSVASEIGLIRFNSSKNNYYDFYRDRVMFPIHDHSGQIRGFSSRAVFPDQVPKYLNSGESFAFDKGAILFGYFFARNHIRQTGEVILVEGNMDVIMMHQHGLQQTVGTMGTTLSTSSVHLLIHTAKKIFLGMDSDVAGKKAMNRINAQFLKNGILPQFLNFLPHKDPDEFLLKEGRLALIERMENAPFYLDVEIGELIPNKILENTNSKLDILQKIFLLVSPLKEALSATERIIQNAKKLGLKSDPVTILESYKEFLKLQIQPPHSSKEKNIQREDDQKLIAKEREIDLVEIQARNLQFPNTDMISAPPTKSERLFTREIICHPEILTQIKIDELLATMRHNEVKRLVHWIYKIYFEVDDSEYISVVQEELQAGNYCKELISAGTDALFHFGTKYNEKVIKKMLKDYMSRLRMDQLKLRRQELAEKQKTSATQIEIDLILGEISKLDKEILNLKNPVPSI